MTAHKPKHYLIIDLEATCDQGNTLPRDESEIIEIGAMIQDTETFKIVGQFQTFVCPVRHPQLTEFCKKLTSITQEQVDNAPIFQEAMARLTLWLTNYEDYVFVSWGKYDYSQFGRECAYNGVDYPFGTGHIDMKRELAAIMHMKPRGIQRMLAYFQMEFEGTPHRGIDDVRNIARLIERVYRGVADADATGGRAAD